MQENKENQKMQSVSRAIKKIKEEEEEQKQQGVQAEEPKNPLADTEIMQKPPENPEEEEEGDTLDEDIEDENLYKSEDNTYESLFLDKSMTGLDPVRGSTNLSKEAPPTSPKKNPEKKSSHPSALVSPQAPTKAKEPLEKKTQSSLAADEEIQELQEAEKEIEVVNHMEVSPKKAASSSGEKSLSLRKSDDIPTQELTPTSAQEHAAQKKAKSEDPSAQPKTSLSSMNLLPPVDLRATQKQASFSWRLALSYKVSAWFLFPFIIALPFLILGLGDGKDIAPIVQIQEVQKGTFEPVLVIAGKIVSPKKEIHSTVAGVVTEIFYKKGEFVSSGDAIVKIRNPHASELREEAEQELALASLEYEEAVWDLILARKRQEAEKGKDSGEKMIGKRNSLTTELREAAEKWLKAKEERLSEKEIALREAALEKERNRWETAGKEPERNASSTQIRLSFALSKHQLAWQKCLRAIRRARQAEKEQTYLVCAPENGKIGLLFVSVDSTVSVGSKIATMVDPKQKLLEANVCSSFRAHIEKNAKVGFKADIQFPFMGKPTLGGQPVSIAFAPEWETQSDDRVKVTINLSLLSTELPEEASVVCKIALPAKENCSYVPREAVFLQNEGERRYPILFTLRGEESQTSIQKVPVRLGLGNEHCVEILSGLSEEESVVVTASLPKESLQEGMLVQVSKK